LPSPVPWVHVSKFIQEFAEILVRLLMDAPKPPPSTGLLLAPAHDKPWDLGGRNLHRLSPVAASSIFSLYEDVVGISRPKDLAWAVMRQVSQGRREPPESPYGLRYSNTLFPSNLHMVEAPGNLFDPEPVGV
jgi:hypothetical protein